MPCAVRLFRDCRIVGLSEAMEIDKAAGGLFIEPFNFESKVLSALGGVVLCFVQF